MASLIICQLSLGTALKNIISYVVSLLQISYFFPLSTGLQFQMNSLFIVFNCPGRVVTLHLQLYISGGINISQLTLIIVLCERLIFSVCGKPEKYGEKLFQMDPKTNVFGFFPGKIPKQILINFKFF